MKYTDKQIALICAVKTYRNTFATATEAIHKAREFEKYLKNTDE